MVIQMYHVTICHPFSVPQGQVATGVLRLDDGQKGQKQRPTHWGKSYHMFIEPVAICLPFYPKLDLLCLRRRKPTAIENRRKTELSMFGKNVEFQQAHHRCMKPAALNGQLGTFEFLRFVYSRLLNNRSAVPKWRHN